MAEKDVTQKILEANNDVFADIVNGLIFQGKQVVQADELQDLFSISAYESEAKLHSMERDVSKLWKHGTINIACIGAENQVRKDLNMPLRVIAYDGAEYRKQINKKRAELYPVITLVLYFGKQKWRKPRSLLDRIKILPELEPFVSDYRINVFDISHMTKQDVALFKNDFKVVVDYFAQVNESGSYNGNKQTLKHPVETYQLMKYLTGNQNYKDFIDAREGGPINMYDPFEDWKARGEAIGEARLAKLLQKLYELGRTEDVQKAINNKSYRDSLMKKFAIQ